MKKSIALFLVLVSMILIFAGCGGKKTDAAAEACESMIVYKQGQCSPMAGIMTMDFSLAYTGGEQPEDLKFTVRANDGLFNDRKSVWFEEKDDCTTDGDYYWQWYTRENFYVENGEQKYKDESGPMYYTGDGIYISVIAKDGENIIGYTVSKLYPFLTLPASQITEEMKGMARMYIPVELESKAFPKVDGKWQDISAEYVQKLIDAAVTAGADTVPEGHEDLLALESQ